MTLAARFAASGSLLPWRRRNGSTGAEDFRTSK
jgi:hypothetical protein